MNAVQMLLYQGRQLWSKQRWSLVLLGGISVAVLGALVWSVLHDWRQLLNYQWQMDWYALVYSGVMFALALGLSVLAWLMIIRSLGVQSNWRQDARFFLYSWMARRLPTPAPYIASRVLLYERIGVSKRLVSIGMVWEQILTAAASALLCLLLLPFTSILDQYLTPLPIVLAVIAGLALIMFPTPLARAINYLLRRYNKSEVPEAAIRPLVALSALVLYLLVWLSGGLMLFFLIRSVYPLGWTALPEVLQGWTVSGLVSYLVFLAPFGFGLRDMTMAALLNIVLPLSVAVIATILVRLWTTINELIWAAIFLKL